MASYAVAKMVFVCSVKTTVLSATEIIELKYSRLLLSKAIPLFRQMLNTREVIALLRVLVKDLFMNGKKIVYTSVDNCQTCTVLHWKHTFVNYICFLQN